MLLLIIGIILFVGTHSISMININFRNAMVSKLGLSAWQGLYALISVVGVVLIAKGYSEARVTAQVLYTTPEWFRYIVLILMFIAFPLFFAGVLPGRISQTIKNPMLVSVKTWAFAHLLVNGSVADVVLFAPLLAWAIMDRISLKKRSITPMMSIPPGMINDILAVVLGLLSYAAFILYLHEKWIGVALF